MLMRHKRCLVILVQDDRQTVGQRKFFDLENRKLRFCRRSASGPARMTRSHLRSQPAIDDENRHAPPRRLKPGPSRPSSTTLHASACVDRSIASRHRRILDVAANS